MGALKLYGCDRPIRGGIVSVLEAIARGGLSAHAEAELRQKFEATTSDVE